jgi:hypothetical protein
MAALWVACLVVLKVVLKAVSKVDLWAASWVVCSADRWAAERVAA